MGNGPRTPSLPGLRALAFVVELLVLATLVAGVGASGSSDGLNYTAQGYNPSNQVKSLHQIPRPYTSKFRLFDHRYWEGITTIGMGGVIIGMGMLIAIPLYLRKGPHTGCSWSGVNLREIPLVLFVASLAIGVAGVVLLQRTANSANGSVNDLKTLTENWESGMTSAESNLNNAIALTHALRSSCPGIDSGASSATPYLQSIRKYATVAKAHAAEFLYHIEDVPGIINSGSSDVRDNIHYITILFIVFQAIAILVGLVNWMVSCGHLYNTLSDRCGAKSHVIVWSIVAFLSWCACGFLMASSVGVGDLCVDLHNNIGENLSKRRHSELATFYLTCDTQTNNTLRTFSYATMRASFEAREYVPGVQIKATEMGCPIESSRIISDIGGSLSASRSVASTILPSTECQFINPSLSEMLHSDVCNDGMSSFILLWTSVLICCFAICFQTFCYYASQPLASEITDDDQLAEREAASLLFANTGIGRNSGFIISPLGVLGKPLTPMTPSVSTIQTKPLVLRESKSPKLKFADPPTSTNKAKKTISRNRSPNAKGGMSPVGLVQRGSESTATTGTTSALLQRVQRARISNANTAGNGSKRSSLGSPWAVLIRNTNPSARSQGGSLSSGSRLAHEAGSVHLLDRKHEYSGLYDGGPLLKIAPSASKSSNPSLNPDGNSEPNLLPGNDKRPPLPRSECPYELVHLSRVHLKAQETQNSDNKLTDIEWSDVKGKCIGPLDAIPGGLDAVEGKPLRPLHARRNFQAKARPLVLSDSPNSVKPASPTPTDGSPSSRRPFATASPRRASIPLHLVGNIVTPTDKSAEGKGESGNVESSDAPQAPKASQSSPVMKESLSSALIDDLKQSLAHIQRNKNKESPDMDLQQDKKHVGEDDSDEDEVLLSKGGDEMDLPPSYGASVTESDYMTVRCPSSDVSPEILARKSRPVSCVSSINSNRSQSERKAKQGSMRSKHLSPATLSRKPGKRRARKGRKVRSRRGGSDGKSCRVPARNRGDSGESEVVIDLRGLDTNAKSTMLDTLLDSKKKMVNMSFVEETEPPNQQTSKQAGSSELVIDLRASDANAKSTMLETLLGSQKNLVSLQSREFEGKAMGGEQANAKKASAQQQQHKPTIHDNTEELVVDLRASDADAKSAMLHALLGSHRNLLSEVSGFEEKGSTTEAIEQVEGDNKRNRPISISNRNAPISNSISNRNPPISISISKRTPSASNSINNALPPSVLSVDKKNPKEMSKSKVMSHPTKGEGDDDSKKAPELRGNHGGENSQGELVIDMRGSGSEDKAKMLEALFGSQKNLVSGDNP
ncbi:hypothetical protein AAMO2058_000888500 [Amorphochlora amoebiformis]